MGEERARGTVALAGSGCVCVVSGVAALVCTCAVVRGRAWVVVLGRSRVVPHYLTCTAALLLTCCTAALLTPPVRAVAALGVVERPVDRTRVQGVVHVANVLHVACVTACVAALAWTPATLTLRAHLQDVYAFHAHHYTKTQHSRVLLDGVHRGVHCCGLLWDKERHVHPWSCCDTTRAHCRPARHGGLHPQHAFQPACDAVLVRGLHVLHALLDAGAVLAAALTLLHRLLLLHFFSAVHTVHPIQARLHRAQPPPLLDLLLR